MMRRIACLLLTFALVKPLPGGSAGGCASHATADPAQHATMAVMVMDGEEPTSSSETRCQECPTPPGQQAPCDHSSPVGACASVGSCVETLAVVDVSALMSPSHDSGVPGRKILAPEVPAAAPESPPPRA